MGWTTGVQLPAGAMIGLFLFATASRPVLGPTQPPVKWVPETLIAGVTALLHVVPRLRMHGAVPTLRQYVFMAWCLIKRYVFIA
jgi:hypothetical protein